VEQDGGTRPAASPWSPDRDSTSTFVIRDWQEHFLRAVLRYGASLGLVAYVPSVWLSLEEGLYFIALADTLAYAFILVLALKEQISYTFKAISICGLAYAIGLLLLIAIGPFGGGPVWLFAFPLIVGILLGPRAVVLGLVVNIVTVIAVGLLVQNGYGSWAYPTENPLSKWIVMSVNFIALNTLTALAVSSALRGLDRALTQERGMRQSLNRQAEEIEQTNKKLLAEITERRHNARELEETHCQLLQAQKMEAVGRLAGGVAHDFNNLLTVIIGNAALARTFLEPDPEMSERLAEIEAASQRAANLTRQLLAFSRKQVIELQVIDSNELIEGLHKMLKRLIGEDIEFSTHPQRPLGRIEADPGQIEQILVNLVVNSRDAMPEGGKLSIETADVTLDAEYCKEHSYVQAGDYVKIAVADSGIGMDAEIRRQIFEPFFTPKPEGKGSGLGMATVYGIVKQHNGYIEVASESGKGATFEIFFPRIDAQAEAIRGCDIAEELPGGTEVILLVEDEKQVRDVTTHLLESLGYTVLRFDSGRAALEGAQRYSGTISLLLTDVIMPELNGRQLADRLVEERSGLKVLYMSGHIEDTIAHHGILDAGVELINKPFSHQALATRVRGLLDSQFTDERTA